MSRRTGWEPVIALPLASSIDLLTRQAGFCVRADNSSICSGGNGVKYYCCARIGLNSLPCKEFRGNQPLEIIC
jgi:hypothetical protein